LAWVQTQVSDSPTDVRFGSKADIAASPTNVCFTPKRTSVDRVGIRFVPKADIMSRSKDPPYSKRFVGSN